MPFTTTFVTTATAIADNDTAPEIRLNASPAWFSPDAGNSRHVVWGDVNGDGSLDMVVARGDRGVAIYLNEHGTISRTGIELPDNPTATRAALGDMDNDGDLDLVTAAGWPSPTPWYNRIYRNDIVSGSAVTFTAAFTGFVGFNLADGQDMGDVALGDMNRDGDLDMAVALVGSSGAPNRLYRNDSSAGTIAMTELWTNDPAYNPRYKGGR